MVISDLANAPAVIFDLDGTLLNTLKDLADCHNRILVSQGFPPHPVEAYKYFVGDGARNCVVRALPETARTEQIINQCVELQAKDYANNWHMATKEYQGITTVLQQLVDNNNRIAVLSNKNHQFTELCLRHFFPKIEFDVVQGYMPGIPHKPNPIGALMIAEKLGVECCETVFVGDSGVDMLTAVAAGMCGIGALWGFRTDKELLAAGASGLMESPLQLLEIINT
jgi:phosphoglycolate phosphatase